MHMRALARLPNGGGLLLGTRPHQPRHALHDVILARIVRVVLRWDLQHRWDHFVVLLDLELQVLLHNVLVNDDDCNVL